MMARIVADAERHIKEKSYYEPRERGSRLSIAETICEATAHAADDLDLRGIAPADWWFRSLAAKTQKVRREVPRQDRTSYFSWH
jgi:pyruvate kinase